MLFWPQGRAISTIPSAGVGASARRSSATAKTFTSLIDLGQTVIVVARAAVAAGALAVAARRLDVHHQTVLLLRAIRRDTLLANIGAAREEHTALLG
mmetsp:Transcript_36942/g.68189  ORF Transcript_36942/g.68189 Transcript_36942/m.68189 type:complete len:97 (+) Transcript_36942:813-1103(+)